VWASETFRRLWKIENRCLYGNSNPEIFLLDASSGVRVHVFFFKKSQFKYISNLLTKSCWSHSCSFVYHSLQFLDVIYFIPTCGYVSMEWMIYWRSVRSEWYTKCQYGVNDVMNVSIEWMLYWMSVRSKWYTECQYGVSDKLNVSMKWRYTDCQYGVNVIWISVRSDDIRGEADK